VELTSLSTVDFPATMEIEINGHSLELSFNLVSNGRRIMEMNRTDTLPIGEIVKKLNGVRDVF
jgi:hypothetical protein